jgi:nitric-oxide synthase
VQTLKERVREIRSQLDATGTYTHSLEELTFGAKVAWRNSSRCIGRLYWKTLVVRDRRHVTTPQGIYQELCEHLTLATNGGRIRPMMSVFAPDSPGRPGPRVWNDQLVRYAGHRTDEGKVVGDPAYADFTDLVRHMGWKPEGGPHEVLPLIIEAIPHCPRLFELPPDVVTKVPLSHPDYPWFGELHLQWYAVPAISHMRLRIGGIDYPLAPFNGWYMGTEIGARNLVDSNRYDLLRPIARHLGLDTSKDTTLWRDRALVEINIAVLYSFQNAGIRISDHHTESRNFLRHVEAEERQGRVVPADWSWIVPPMSGGITPVFHRYYTDTDLRPNFYIDSDARARARGQAPRTGNNCPLNI